MAIFGAPQKRRTAACDRCVDVDTFSHRLGPRKGEPSISPTYTKETKMDAERHQRQRRVVDAFIIHRTHQRLFTRLSSTHALHGCLAVSQWVLCGTLVDVHSSGRAS